MGMYVLFDRIAYSMVLSLSLRILCVLCVSAVLLNDSSKNRRDAENAENAEKKRNIATDKKDEDRWNAKGDD